MHADVVYFRAHAAKAALAHSLAHSHPVEMDINALGAGGRDPALNSIL